MKKSKWLITICALIAIILSFDTLININRTHAKTEGHNTVHIKDGVMKIGWFYLDPYFIPEKSLGGITSLTGLDVQLTRAITKVAGYIEKYTYIPWGTQIRNLKEGEQHFAGTATYTKERTSFVHFSKPYRREENSFYVRKGDGAKFSFKPGDMTTFLQEVKSNKLKIAITAGWAFASDEINKFIQDPKNKHHFIETKGTYDNVNLLLRGNVDAVLDDRVAASTAIWKSGSTEKLEEVFLGIGVPIHFMFSKKLVPKAVVDKFNYAIDKVRGDGTYGQLTQEYLFPVLLLQTIERPWFFALEAMAILALALSGLLIAYRERFNLYGAIFIAFISMSGSIIRDLLVNRPKLGIMLTPFYTTGILGLTAIGIAVMWGYQHFFRHKKPTPKQQKHVDATMDWGISLLEAFGLAAFTVTGVIMALISKLHPLWLWGPLLAVITTTSGGILRDIVRGRTSTILTAQLHGEVALVWGLFLSLVLTWQSDIMTPEAMFLWVVITVVGSFVTRILIKYYNVKAIPFNFSPKPVKATRPRAKKVQKTSRT